MYHDQNHFLNDWEHTLVVRPPGMPNQPSFPGGPNFPPPPPPGGFPGGPPPGQGPFPGGPQPMSAPPAFSPPMPAWQQGHQGIRRCMYRNTYVWLNNGNSFWFYPTFFAARTMIGYRWRRNRWVYDSLNLDRVSSFQCF